MIRCITTSTNSRITETVLKNLNLARNTSLIDVTNPSLKEIRELHERFHIATADINACLDPYESPRIKQTKHYTLIIYSEYHCNEILKKCAPIGFFFTKTENRIPKIIGIIHQPKSPSVINRLLPQSLSILNW